jgi:N1-aminopropylagmatine ureohydrolase
MTTEPDIFLGIEPEESVYESARAVVLPVPYEGTVSFKGGTSSGPAALLDASREVELYDEELDAEPWREGIHTLPPLRAAADPATMMARIRDVAAPLGEDGKLVLAVGGEHAITPPFVEAVRARRGPVTVLVLDAHADLRTEYGGTPLSHACTSHRLLGSGPVVIVGARAFCAEESELARRRNVPLFTARDLAGRPTSEWVEDVIAHLGQEVYISLDVDALDPSIMPATGTPVPGGLLWWETLALLRAVSVRRKIVGLDLVELAPIPDLVAPDFLAAQLAYKMLGYALLEGPGRESGAVGN